MSADRWVWVAVLADGTRVKESEVGGFGFVDRERCVALELWPSTGLRKRPVTVRVDPCAGERVVFFRRRTFVVKCAPDAAPRDNGTLTVAGWESLRGNGYLVGHDDGRVEIRASLEGA